MRSLRRYTVVHEAAASTYLFKICGVLYMRFMTIHIYDKPFCQFVALTPPDGIFQCKEMLPVMIYVNETPRRMFNTEVWQLIVGRSAWYLSATKYGVALTRDKMYPFSILKNV